MNPSRTIARQIKDDELEPAEAERRAREVAQRMLTTPKKAAASQKRDRKAMKKKEPAKAG